MNRMISLGLDTIKGCVKALLPETVKEGIRIRRNRIRALECERNLRQTDVFLVGHPKSGNTWLAYMLGIVLQRDQHGKVTLANIGQYVPNIHHCDERVAEFKHLSSPRIFRNESPVFADQYPKTIYLIRDPRAVLLSYYHHWLHDKNQEDGKLEDFIEEMLAYGCIKHWEPHLIRWDIQVTEWLARAARQPVKIVRYEDLLTNRRRILRDVIDFAGISCGENLFSLAVDRGDFNNMRSHEQQHGAESYPGERGGSKGFFVRKGKADSWKEEMSKGVIRKIEDKFRATMKATGYLS